MKRLILVLLVFSCAVIFARKGGFPQGLTSKTPIKKIKQIQPENKAVADRVKPLVDAGEKVVVLGDFNAHAIADNEFLSSQIALLDKWRAKEGGMKC